MHDLLVFDIARDGIGKLVDWFDQEVGVKLDATHWRHVNQHHTYNHSEGDEDSNRERHVELRVCDEQHAVNGAHV